MHKRKCKISIFVILALCFNWFSPLFSGNDDDGGCEDGGGFDLFLGGGFVLMPIFWPDFDGHRGRALIQLPGTTTAVPVLAKPIVQQVLPKMDQDKDLSVVDNQDVPDGHDIQDTSQEEPPFPHVSKKPMVDDDYGREVITMDHGSVDNPFMVSDHGLYHLGALIGAAVVEPHSMVQFNMLSKWQLTKGNWAHRMADNYEDARKMKWGKTPKKAEDFEDWEIGDWMRKNGIVGLTIYGGVGWMTADVRAGALARGIWSRHIQKIGANLVRITFTREGEGGPMARAQAVPLQKIETKKVFNHEDTRVYLFDLNNEEERKGLEDVLDKHMLPAKSLADELAEEQKATLLTTREVSRKKSTNTPFQFGIPFIFRYRNSFHNDKPVTTITNHRNDTETVIKSKAYLHQKMYRHINLPKTKKGKKWKHFMHTHLHYNRSYAGSTVAVKARDNEDAVPTHTRHLNVQISFSHDNAKVKKVNEYAELISQRVGVNNFVIDTGYKTDARIGYVELVYTLKVGPDALEQLIEDNTNEIGIFKNDADELINNYFDELRDPHEICKSSHVRLRERCIRKEREETQVALKKIEGYLLKLNKDKIRESGTKSAYYLARIAKKLATNQFVLQAFIMSLPEKPAGYGKLEMFGEQFLAKRFKVDPNTTQGVDNSHHEEADDDDYLVVDWARIDAAEEGNDIY